MEFDDEWINSYDQKMNNSGKSIKIFYCYVDKENTLHKINQELIEVKNNIITKDELIRLIINNKKKHQLHGILSFIVGEVDDQTNYTEFMKTLNIEDIVITPSHQALETTNSVFLIFKEFSKKLKSNCTKKIYISSSRNTRRKRLKANKSEV